MDTLVVRVRPGETRIACVDGDGRLKDFAVYRDQAPGEVGDVFWARVKKVVPNLEAAFIDIGAERDGFLGLAEARPQPFMGGEAPRDRISDYVREGEAVMVQVLASARDDKGAKLSRRVSVSGAYVVLTPNDPGIRVSKRISDDGERSRLRTMLSSVLAGDEGCVIRSSAQGVREKLVAEDLRLLRGRWKILCDHAKGSPPPALVSGDVPPALQFLAESGHGNYNKILVDDGVTGEQIEIELTKLGVLPSGGVSHVTTHFDIFETAGIQDDVAGLLSPRVGLPGGGSIVIEQTSALTTIDVNAGAAKAKATGRGPQNPALASNIEAMREIARQIRLRNLSGLIVVDYIGMRGKDSIGRMVSTLKDAMMSDPVGPQILGTTKGGLLEITRPRRRPPLAQVLATPCPSCDGAGQVEAPLSVGYRALDQVLADVWADPALIPILNVPKCVFEALKEKGQEALSRMEAKLGQPLDVRLDATLQPDAFRIDRD